MSLLSRSRHTPLFYTLLVTATFPKTATNFITGPTAHSPYLSIRFGFYYRNLLPCIAFAFAVFHLMIQPPGYPVCISVTREPFSSLRKQCRCPGNSPGFVNESGLDDHVLSFTIEFAVVLRISLPRSPFSWDPLSLSDGGHRILAFSTVLMF